MNLHSEEYELKFKPFGEVVYFYNNKGENENISSISPQIYRTDSLLPNGKFQYSPLNVSTLSRPPNDLSGGESAVLTKKGATYFWEEIRFDFPRDLPIDAVDFARWSLLFPYFPKDRYKIGMHWEMKLPIPITFTLLDFRFLDKLKMFFRSNAKVTFKFERVADMLGFRCAEIRFLIADSLKTESGETLRFVCNGTTHFAIEEGFIVSEIMDISHDILTTDKRVTYKGVKRKLRMVNYEPYSAGKN